MPSASELSATPSANVTIGGFDIGENCSPSGVNDVIRYLAAIIRTVADATPAASTGIPASGGVFTGDITREGQGGYLHHAGGAQTGGMVYFLPEGSPRPAAAEGTVVFYYT